MRRIMNGFAIVWLTSLTIAAATEMLRKAASATDLSSTRVTSL